VLDRGPVAFPASYCSIARFVPCGFCVNVIGYLDFILVSQLLLTFPNWPAGLSIAFTFALAGCSDGNEIVRYRLGLPAANRQYNIDVPLRNEISGGEYRLTAYREGCLHAVMNGARRGREYVA